VRLHLILVRHKIITYKFGQLFEVGSAGFCVKLLKAIVFFFFFTFNSILFLIIFYFLKTINNLLLFNLTVLYEFFIVHKVFL